MRWLFSNSSPVYTQLVEQIKAGIVTGEFPSGERLPSVRELSTEAGVNPNTMQRAMSELERENLVFCQRTAGRFVTENQERITVARRDLAQQHMRVFINAMLRLGYGSEDILTLLREELMPPECTPGESIQQERISQKSTPFQDTKATSSNVNLQKYTEST